jgi:ATP-dependent DNA helicase DinG
MEAVAEKVAPQLAKQFGITLLMQGKASRQKIIDSHKATIDKDLPSVIFGSQSFSEGLDLPGKDLTNVIITKIPFAVPTSPVEEAHAEYIKARGGNAFMELSIPQASKKLVQACGRLLRNEKDTGRVVILDRRLVNKRYGKAMLDALPPFKRVIEY